MKYETIESFDDISAPGVYIVSFWNSSSIDSEIHTVMVKVDEMNKVTVYNDNKNPNWNPDLNAPRIFITGYQVSRK